MILFIVKQKENWNNKIENIESDFCKRKSLILYIAEILV